MKEYKHNEELLEHLKNKNVIIDDDNIALNIIDNYSYYSVINTYKYVLKKEDNTYFEIFILMKYILYMILIKI